MAIGMQKRKRGIFGGSSAPTMPQGGADYGAMEPGLGMQQQQQKPGLGTRLLGEGWEGKVSAIGSALQGNFNAIPDHHAQQQAIQQQTAQQAEMLRRQSIIQAQKAQDARSLAEYRSSLPTAQMKNFENFQGMEVGQQQQFLQYQDAVNPLGSIGPDGRFYNRPRASQAPTKPVGKLTPIGPTTQNTPAPQLNFGGMPASLTGAQYQATVSAMGKAETDAWMRRHNIRVTN